jgi:hypothetical protein
MTQTFFGRLIAAIGGFFAHLLNGAKSAFDELPKQQQDAIIQGVNISQILKDGYTKGVAFVLSEIEAKLNIPEDVATQLLQTALKDIGINEADLQTGFAKLADKLQSGVTDNNWNSLWQTVASSAAQWLSTGSLNWVSLAMGLIEWAFQHFVKAPATA